MLDVKNIWLTSDEIAKCRSFAMSSAPTQQSIEFGQKSTKARSVCEIARDTYIGKLAEVAFSKMLKENYNIDVSLDFNCYAAGKWDDQDAVINGWRIDIKGTRSGGHWLLIEWNKLVFRQRDNNLSHIYAMFSVDWDRTSDEPTGRVSYEGAVSLDRLNDHSPKTRILRKGDLIPGTNTRLQADNYAIRFNDLYKHLNHLIRYITESAPPARVTDMFRNPYTGQTTAEILKEVSSQATQVETSVPCCSAFSSLINSIIAKFKKCFSFFIKMH